MAEERADFRFEAGGIGPDTWRVVRFHGTEAISRPFRFDVELDASDAEIDFDSVVGQPAALSIALGQGERTVRGVVSRIELLHVGPSGVRYAARLVPRVWTLSLRRQSRIFPERTTSEILAEVLETAGIPGDAFRVEPKRTFAARHFTVQYRETDLDFLSRLAEEEGIFFFFDHSGETDAIVLADRNDKFPAIAGDAAVPLREGGTGLGREEEIDAFWFGQSARPGAVAVRDFDFKKPALSLEAVRAGNAEAAFEVYEYPGAFPDLEIGAEVAEIRLQEARVQRELGGGRSRCQRFFAGGVFELEGHANPALDRKYVLTRVHHWGSQPQAASADASGAGLPATYRNEFECIPFDVPFRPRRATPRPRIEGPQTATVTGPAGEEIHADAFGRVTVRFPWDRRDVGDDTSSHWVRVSQGSGGAGWGTLFLPRVGTEVVVEFLDGDPNRPVITGRVFNGEFPPPFPLPDKKTVSGIRTATSPGGGGFNELSFDDTSGAMLVHMQAQKDLNIDVVNNKDQTVGADERLSVGSTRGRSVGGSETVTIDGNQAQLILAGTTLKVKGSQSITIDGSQIALWGLGKSEDVTGNWSEKVGALRLAAITGSLSLEVAGSINETIAALKLTTMSKDYSRDVGAVDTVTVAARKLNVKGGFATSAAAIAYTIGGLFKLKAGADLAVKGKSITVTAATIDLKGGGSSVKLGGGPIVMKGSKFVAGDGSITIKGSTAKVNS
jgi:type VI secretion system secreted protein VgrG